MTSCQITNFSFSAHVPDDTPVTVGTAQPGAGDWNGTSPARLSTATASRRARASIAKRSSTGTTRMADAPSPRSSAALRRQLCPSAET